MNVRYFFSTALLALVVFMSSDARAQVGVSGDAHDKPLPFAAPVALGTAQASDIWYVDRFAPAAFESVASFGGRTDVLRQSISDQDCRACRGSSFSGAFYDTQGRKHDTPQATRASIDLFVPQEWQGADERFAGFWATVGNINYSDSSTEDNVTGYPIIEFYNGTFRGWDGSGGWIPIGLPSDFEYDSWQTLTLEIRGNEIVYSVGDVEVVSSSQTSDEHYHFGNVILQGHNTEAGVTYDIHWDNLVTVRPVLNTDQNLVYAQLQPAVTEAASNDTLQVTSATVFGNTVINKPLAIVSESGPSTAILQGKRVAGSGATIQLVSGADDVTIGGAETGLTIIGTDDNELPAQERGAISFTGAVSGVSIIGNEIRAHGSHGLFTNANIAVTDLLIDGNTFSGQTFLGESPAGWGFTGSGGQTDQFAVPNVPRQLVVVSGGASNVTFTNNVLAGTAGGLNDEVSPREQGNTLATIDAANSTIQGNTFTGLTARWATQLRARAAGTNINDNVFDNSAAVTEGLLGSGGALFVGNSFDGEITGNEFISNPGYALNNGTSNTINARDNYWGDDSGPLDEKSLPAGGGGVINNVDAEGGRVIGDVYYWPWFTEALTQTPLVPVTPIASDGNSIDNRRTLYTSPSDPPLLIEYQADPGFVPTSVTQRKFEPDSEGVPQQFQDVALAANLLVQDVNVSDGRQSEVLMQGEFQASIAAVILSGRFTSFVQLAPGSIPDIEFGDTVNFQLSVNHRRYRTLLRVADVRVNGQSQTIAGCTGERIMNISSCAVGPIEGSDVIIEFIIDT